MRIIPDGLVLRLLTATLIVVGAAGTTAGWLALRLYGQRSELRLNPVNDRRYAQDNARLAPRSGRRVVVVGDSRVQQWSPRPNVPGMEFLWRGVNGETTAQLRYRFPQDALRVDATDIIIQAGINDLVAGIALGEGASASAAAQVNLRQMAEAGAAAGAAVYLLTVVRPAKPPLWRRPVWSDSIYGLVATLNAQLRSLDGGNIHIIDADRLLANGDGPLPEGNAVDTVHFSAAAYKALNSTLSEQLIPSGHAIQ